MQRSVSSTCPSPTTSSSPPLSRTSSYTDISIEISHSSDVLNAQYTVGVMQGSLDALQDVLQNLTDQTLYPGLTENSKLSKELAEIRKGLESVDVKHAYGQEEIGLLMDKLMKEQAIDELRGQVNKEITLNMDKLVKEEVEAYLQNTIPLNLQQDVQKSKKELDEVSRELHNSESKRMNALLREKNRHEPIHTIFRSNGTISEHFPKTLEDLFNIDASTCKALVNDYDIESPDGTSKDGNLNRFMQFCGVQFQMVRRGNSTKRVAFEM